MTSGAEHVYDVERTLRVLAWRLKDGPGSRFGKSTGGVHDGRVPSGEVVDRLLLCLDIQSDSVTPGLVRSPTYVADFSQSMISGVQPCTKRAAARRVTALFAPIHSGGLGSKGRQRIEAEMTAAHQPPRRRRGVHGERDGGESGIFGGTRHSCLRAGFREPGSQSACRPQRQHNGLFSKLVNT